jgi:hypothetical protein
MEIENLRLDEAIHKSVHENRIVKLHHTPFRHEQLFLASDDCVTDESCTEWEYWTDNWRIHLVRT